MPHKKRVEYESFNIDDNSKESGTDDQTKLVNHNIGQSSGAGQHLGPGQSSATDTYPSTLETEIVSMQAKKKGKQKAKRGRPCKWSPLGDAEGGSDQPLQKMQQEALTVYLLTEDPFLADEITQNDQCPSMESEEPRRLIKWKKRIDRFFNAALEENEDASALDLIPKITNTICSVINNKQSALHWEAFAAAMPIVEMQYKLKDHLGTFKEPGEIQKIVEEELGGESFQWTTRKAYLASEPSGIKCIFFNLCIPSLVTKVAFSKGGLCVGVLAQYHHKFNPIPLPLIAYAGTLAYAILHGYSTGYWSKGHFTAGEFCPVYLHCVEALDLLIKGSPQMYELLSRSIYKHCMREAEVAGKLPHSKDQIFEPSKLAIPKLPNLSINSEDFNNPWHAPSNAKGNGRAHWHHDPVSDPDAIHSAVPDTIYSTISNTIYSAVPNTIYSAIPDTNHSQSDIDETQENCGENLYDYAGGADHLALNTPSSPCNPQGHCAPPKPAQ